MVKNLPDHAGDTGDAMPDGKTPEGRNEVTSSILAWEFLSTEELGRRQSQQVAKSGT